MFARLATAARTSIPRNGQVRTMAAPRHTPPLRADFFQKNWTQDPGKNRNTFFFFFKKKFQL